MFKLILSIETHTVVVSVFCLFASCEFRFSEMSLFRLNFTEKLIQMQFENEYTPVEQLALMLL